MDGVLSGVKLLPNVPTGTVGTIEWHSIERTPLPKPNSRRYLLLGETSDDIASVAEFSRPQTNRNTVLSV